MVDIDGPAAVKDLEYIVDTCDVVFWVASNADVPKATEYLTQVFKNSTSRKAKMRFVCLCDRETLVAESVESYRHMVEYDFKVPIDSDAINVSNSDRVTRLEFDGFYIICVAFDWESR